VILLDTDHISIVQSKGPWAADLIGRMSESHDQDFGVSAVTLEEQMRGWLALIHRLNKVHQQIPAYERLVGLFEFFAQWRIIPFDQGAADEFARLRERGVRIGTMDLKIAATALANGGMLLSANLRDFEKVPGLRVENWLGAGS
jgi:tRNA(fMet)-specific endonuclease VapC